ncbi:hypothetical protein [Wolbachia endosymbiont (group A) of Nomada hirtipes]|uniref:hypothetical protein n=1 Tax=Wolbachia endosymbiont (group A) of Nomada hirtipes TaxID=3066208 RepID=UPI0030CF24DB
MLLACYSHKHISYRIRTIIRKAIIHVIDSSLLCLQLLQLPFLELFYFPTLALFERIYFSQSLFSYYYELFYIKVQAPKQIM